MNEKTVNVNDVFYFETSWNKKQNKESFIGYDEYGKVIISDKVLDRGGFFEIKKVKKTADNYTIVSLGKRVKADDLYPEINLEEAVEILKNFGFEVYEKKLSFKAWNEDRIETQLFAWNKELNIFVNGTTWENSHFNDLNIIAPNYLKTFKWYSHGQFVTSMEDIKIDVVNMHNDEKILKKLKKYAESSTSNRNINMVFFDEDKNENSYNHLWSYATKYIYANDSINYLDEYSEEIYNKLPESGKQFIQANRHK